MSAALKPDAGTHEGEVRPVLIFRNPGLIDIRAATTMGINAKADEGAIGFFGTGLKYSIACILRWGGEITIYRGLEEFRFAAKTHEVRGKEFSIVCMNDRELGFVTDYGKTWEPWQVYRELYTNMHDEGGTVDCGREFCPAEGETTVIVTCEKLLVAHEGRDQFILRSAPSFRCDDCDIHEGSNRGIFYQNLLVSQPPRPCMFTYNIKRKVALTEDRTLKNNFEFDVAVTKAVEALCESDRHTDHERAKEIMLADEGFWEHQVCFSLITAGQRSERFYAMAEFLMKLHASRLNHSIRELLLARKPLKQSIETFEPSDFQKNILRRATSFAERIGFAISDYPVVCAERLGDGVLGLAHQGTIYVTRGAFELGTKMVASTLIEEFLHLREGIKDFTREMQEVLFNRLITLAEEHVWGEPL